MMTRLSKDEAQRTLAGAQKPGTGVPAYLRWVNRPLGGRVAAFGATVGWSPNGLTAVSAVLGALGIATLVMVTAPWSGVVASLALLAGYVFDSADGQLARIQGRSGPAGEWLDHVVDGVRAPLVHIAVAMHLAAVGSPAWLIVLAGVFSVLVSAWFLSQLLAQKLAPRTSRAPESPDRGTLESLVKQLQDPSTTYAVIAIIGWSSVFLVAYTALFAWQSVVFVASLRRKYRQLAAA